MSTDMKTLRLTLRPLVASDAQRIATLGGDWDVARMTGRIPYPYSIGAAEHWLTGLADGELVFGIEYDEGPTGPQLIGLCGYTRAPDASAEIGYWIGKAYWGHGFATEAARAIIAHGFTKGGVKRFTCCHFTDNLASGRVIEKLGFRATGTCAGWCEARQMDLPTLRYERRRPWTTTIKALAS